MEKSDLYKEIIERLPLLEKDRESLKIKRGFSNEVIQKLQFKSCGSFIENDAFFKGLPVNILNALKSENIVIPYFDVNDNIIHIRPHKFGIKDEPVRVYTPFKLFKEDKTTLVIAESEFKAAASCAYGVNTIGIPGIRSFSKTRFNELRDIIIGLSPQKIIICFDNEIKNDPKFENYKPDYTKRYDTQFYAYITAALLKASKLNVKIATINKEWMIEGKADIDGILASGVSPDEYLTCLANAQEPFTYKEKWDFPISHLSYLERRIDRFFYTGPIEVMDRCYFYQQKDKPNKKISNFLIEISNTLQGRAGAERRGRFVSNYGPSKEFELKPEMMSSKTIFTKFCYENGDYQFEGTDQELAKIWAYIFMHQTGKIIMKLHGYGYDDVTETWFFQNGAYKADVFYPADEDGIVWIDDTGYKLCETMDDLDLSAPTLTDSQPSFDLKEITEKLSEKLGERYAKLLVSWSLGCFFLPEIMKEYGIYPFIFLYGKTGAGKSTISNWISSFFGLEQKGIPFSASSLAGIIRMTTQMSMLPVWFEEYRNKDPNIQGKNNFLRSVYDKSTVVKGTKREDEIKTYKSRSTLIISGEEHPNDSALNSRFIMFPIFKKNENQEAYLWLQKNKSLFNYFGHWILTNKKTLWGDVKKHIDDYIANFRNSPIKIGDRTYLQASIMGGICDALLGDSEDFSLFIGEFAKASDSKREGEQALFVFIEDTINMIGSKKVFFDYADIVTEKDAYGNDSKKVWVWFNGLYNLWEKEYKTLRQDLPAARAALIDHLKNEKYYIESAQKRFGGKVLYGMCFHFEHKDIPEAVRSFFNLIDENQREYYESDTKLLGWGGDNHE